MRAIDAHYELAAGPNEQRRKIEMAASTHNLPQTARPSLQSEKAPSRFKLNRLPGWLKWAIPGAIALLIGFIALTLLFGDPGFTLIVRGAPSGSDVYIDNRRLGTLRADGTIRVAELEAGKRIVRVSNDSYEDFSSSVTGKDGEIKSLTYSSQPTTSQKTSMPSEIDYSGPMVFVPAGEFIMGDDNHDPNEKPAHRVSLPDYYIDKFEVTNAQYKRFCDETSRAYPTNPHWDEQYFLGNPNLPVVGINWHDAADYAKWAGKRLPTEAEWEKAASWDASAGQKRQWPWGSNPDPSRIILGTDRPTAIGQQPGGASAYGAQDMAGNVAEWVDSFYQPYPGNQTPDSNYGTKNRVVRGGHFRLDITDVRNTVRIYHGPEFEAAEKKLRSWLTGFRCAVSADDPRLKEFLRGVAGSR